jgi:hypothetical protein
VNALKAPLDTSDSMPSDGSFAAIPTAQSSNFAYEEQLSQNPEWALSDASQHFQEQSQVFFALRQIAKRLTRLDIDYAIVGDMALFHHGRRRFTEVIDILVTPSDLKTIHERLDGLGYLAIRKHGKNLRDTEFGVRIEFITSGGYPGDGKAKPVAFPDPKQVSVDFDGIKYLNLPTLIELKLASGMTNRQRLIDIADVLELIKQRHLALDFADQLNPYVREEYRKLWHESLTRYISVLPIPNRPAGRSFDALLASMRVSGDPAADKLESMHRDGVMLEWDESLGSDRVRLVSTDHQIAARYDLIEESQFWQRD